jgi:hypothetical protein
VNKGLRRDQRLLLIAAAVSLMCWIVPALKPLALPLVYLNTHVHEFFHAATGMLTGGFADRIFVFASGEGLAEVKGGNLLLVASAGYVGASVLGGLIIVASRDERGARQAVAGLGLLMSISLLLWVRGDAVGVISGVIWLGTFAALWRFGRGHWLTFAAQLVGMQQCLAALNSMFVLLQISAITETHSDAQILAEATGIPDLVWATLWSLLSLGFLAWSLRSAWGPAGLRRRGSSH